MVPGKGIRNQGRINQLAGRIVQLEERLPYTQEVTGSIPVPPTGVVVKLVYNAGLSRRRPRVRIPSTPPGSKSPL